MTGSNTDLFDVSDRLALVTGSSRGLGRALALTLARGGARVVVHGRDAAAVEDTRAEAQELSGRPAHAITFDVTDAAAVESAVGEMLAAVGVPDILVNNAGVQRRAPIHEFPVSDWDDIVAANLSGVFYVSRFVTPRWSHAGRARSSTSRRCSRVSRARRSRPTPPRKAASPS